jgi:hypothetical protein
MCLQYINNMQEYMKIFVFFNIRFYQGHFFSEPFSSIASYYKLM